MLNRKSNPAEATNGASQISLNDIVESLETAWDNGEAPVLSEFLPSPSHPQFEAIACELLCVDFEHRWNRGDASIDEYRAAHPRLSAIPRCLEQLAFEEYRLRLGSGENVDHIEYHRRFHIDTTDWPRPEQAADETLQTGSSTRPIGGGPEQLDEGSPTFPRAGDRYLGFDLVEQIGEGNFGRVFLARQRELANRTVVLKLSTDTWAESDRLARLQHTNIVPIYSVHNDGSIQAVCMPFLGKQTLRDFVRTDGVPVSERGLLGSTDHPDSNDAEHSVLAEVKALTHEKQCLWIASRVAAGLAHAHRRGILHRDIKPANILLSDDGEPMLLDFNLSDDIDEKDRTTVVVGGTLPYMSPEHLRSIATGESIDVRADVYSLGCILYQLLTNHLPYGVGPFTDTQSLALLIEQRLEVPPGVRSHNAAVSSSAQAIVSRCLAPNPEDRYQTAADLKVDIDCQLGELPLKSAAEPFSCRILKWFRRHPKFRSAGFLAATVGLTLALMVVALTLAHRRIERMRALNSFDRFTACVKDARAPLGVPTTDANTNRQAMAAAETALEVFDSRTKPLRSNRNFQRLDEQKQLQVRQLLGELYFRMSNAVRTAALSQTTSRDARQRSLKLNQAAIDVLAPTAIPSAIFQQRGDILDEIGRKLDAIAARARRGTTDDEFSRFVVALRHTQNRNADEAIDLLRLLSKELPEDFFVWHLLGNNLAAKSMDAEAETCFTTCIALRPTADVARYQRGLTRLATKKYPGARDDFSAVLEENPGHVGALFNRALAHRGMKQQQKAIDDLSEALEKRDSMQCRIYLMRSRLWQELGNHEKAEHDREKGISIEPTDALGWNARAMARAKTEPEQALGDVEVALRLNPTSKTALQNHAHILAEYFGKTEDAIRSIDRLLESHEDPSMRAGRGVLKARLGQQDEAMIDAKSAVKDDPRPSPIVCYQVACVYAIASTADDTKAATAIAWLGKAIANDTNWARAAPNDPDLKSLHDNPEFRRIVAAGRLLQAAKNESRSE